MPQTCPEKLAQEAFLYMPTTTSSTDQITGGRKLHLITKRWDNLVPNPLCIHNSNFFISGLLSRTLKFEEWTTKTIADKLALVEYSHPRSHVCKHRMVWKYEYSSTQCCKMKSRPQPCTRSFCSQKGHLRILKTITGTPSTILASKLYERWVHVSYAAHNARLLQIIQVPWSLQICPPGEMMKLESH